MKSVNSGTSYSDPAQSYTSPKILQLELNRTGFLGDLIAWELSHEAASRHLVPRN